MTKPRRKHMGLAVKLEIALRALGVHDVPIEWDHDPALGLRIWDEKAGDYDPPQNDPRFITIRRVDDHKVKTHGTKATTAGSDIQRIAKIHRAEKRAAGQERAKRKIQSRQKPSWPKTEEGGFHYDWKAGRYERK